MKSALGFQVGDNLIGLLHRIRDVWNKDDFVNVASTESFRCKVDLRNKCCLSVVHSTWTMYIFWN
jgi:hypothetical protein